MESTVDSMDKFLDPTRSTEEQPQQQLIPSIGDSSMHSFDVAVSLLDHTKGTKSPLLVVITDSTEHLKVRSTLTALAETQLELLANIVPKHVMQFLAMESSEAVPEHFGQLARAHESVTLLFMDIVGFTGMSKEVKPVQIMAFLNTLFSHFDKLIDIHGVHKVETAGDCYIVSGGLMRQADGFGGMEVEESHDPAESAHRVMEFAKAILDVAAQVEMPNTHQPVRIRIGMHTGDVVSGTIGTKLPKFSVFGDAMNMASRMESTGVPGRIHVSEATRNLLLNEDWEPTGGVEVKGKGLMDSYLWIPQPSQPSVSQHFDASHFLPLPPGMSSAQQPMLDHTLPRIDFSPGKELFSDPHSSHAIKSYGMLNAQERPWEGKRRQEQTSSQQFMEAVPGFSEGMLPHKIIRSTQSLYALGVLPSGHFRSAPILMKPGSLNVRP
ncbi:nucleotide cyclase [Dunaliella salina]|uniref:Nucleotide cyclase n=1 Tax=Dunaliella salina TaxID=3046 RepID=A0ABQ7GAR4_DUNSA|nr:nucleotide cyclase [Dunaliella salina]|eukprot:KAF5831691.1 nucleotide cyclase [Dunaliella salina]